MVIYFLGEEENKLIYEYKKVIRIQTDIIYIY